MFMQTRSRRSGETAAILSAAHRYVIHKSEHGLTVGLHLGCGCYGEGHSPGGDLDEAAGEAFRSAAARARSAKPGD
jgi:hypothetical protein